MLLKTKVHTLGPAAAVTNVTDIGASTSDQVTIVGFFSRVRCACATLKIVPLQDLFFEEEVHLISREATVPNFPPLLCPKSLHYIK